MALGWVQANERVVGKSGAYTDTLNRALRELLSKSGYDPDATFTGIRGPVFNVRAFGATGNGASNDTAAFTAARAAQVAANGGWIWIPIGQYLVDKIADTGASIVPLLIAGDGEGSRINMSATANIAIAIASGANVEGSILKDFIVFGNATQLGGIALGTGTYFAAYTKLQNVRVRDFTKVGGYSLSLNSVQELSVQDSRLEYSYNNVYRPNLGFCTSTVFHGQKGFIGRATNEGALLEGYCTDITFNQQVLESNWQHAIYAPNTAGVGTVSCAGAGAATFTSSQAGKVANTGQINIAGVQYSVSAFNGTTTCTLTNIVTGVPAGAFGATAFTYGFASVVHIADCYFEDNNNVGTAGLAQIDLSGASGQKLHTMIHRNHFHIAHIPNSKHISLDHVAVSKFSDNEGLLSLGNPVVTTANTQIHGEDNADITGDAVALYRAMTGFGTSVTASDTDSSGRRAEMGNRRFENVHILSTQQTAPAIAINANAGTGGGVGVVVSADSTDMKGTITLTTGTAAWAAGPQAFLTFNRPYASQPKVFIVPRNNNAAAAMGVRQVYTNAADATGFFLQFVVAAAANLAHVFDYWVIE